MVKTVFDVVIVYIDRFGVKQVLDTTCNTSIQADKVVKNITKIAKQILNVEVTQATAYRK